jgi:GT2 family glycosyltransferase
MRPITFCVPTARNEREYVLLLLKSLVDNTQHHLHEFLVFIDSDNQNTFEELQKFKSVLPNLKICKNESEFPIGGQRNISIMFNSATNAVVCYLQSDMVVAKDFDKHLNDKLISHDTILCFTRIEPPLHPASNEKIVMDFGMSSDTFRYNDFLEFSTKIQKETRPDTNYHFAPFAVFKDTWLTTLGGYDTQFRCSREDSDFLMRLNLNNINTIQTWTGIVYHFTCVSSRGKDWFKKEKNAEHTLRLQSVADSEEVKRFIRKWGYFGTEPRPVYDITFVIHMDDVVDFNILKWLEPFCTTLLLDDTSVVSQLREQVEFNSYYYSNRRWNYSAEHWDLVKYLFNSTDWNKRIRYGTSVSHGVVVKFNYSHLDNLQAQSIRDFFENIHAIVDKTAEGRYDFNGITIEIFEKINLQESLKKNHNLKLVLEDTSFTFI